MHDVVDVGDATDMQGFRKGRKESWFPPEIQGVSPQEVTWLLEKVRKPRSP